MSCRSKRHMTRGIPDAAASYGGLGLLGWAGLIVPRTHPAAATRVGRAAATSISTLSNRVDSVGGASPYSACTVASASARTRLWYAMASSTDIEGAGTGSPPSMSSSMWKVSA